jgi:hypothetical protein
VLANLLSKTVKNVFKKKLEFYVQHEHLINCNRLKYPVSVKNINAFEEDNPGIRVNVFGYDRTEEIFYPIRISSKRDRITTVDLLLINSHYIAIKNKSRLFSRQHSKGQFYYCDFCLNKFQHERTLSSHIELCQNQQPVKTVFPSGDDVWLTHDKVNHTELLDFYIIYDFESTLGKIAGADDAPVSSWSRKINVHMPNTFCFVTVDSEGKLFTGPYVYTGKDAADVALVMLQGEAERLLLLPSKTMTALTAEQKEKITNAKVCEKCYKPFTIGGAHAKVVDHNHYTGAFRYVLCNACNLQLKMARKVVCIGHNASNYDQFFLLKAIAKQYKKASDKMTIIPKTREKFKSFTFNKLRFIDSYSFLQGSLDKIVKNLSENDFDIFNEVFDEDWQRQLLKNSKQVFPYEYVSSIEKLQETQLPPYEQWYSTLREENVSRSDYEQALHIFQKFGCTSIADFLQLYVICDVLLLACCMQRFRSVNYAIFQLDCLRFISAPSYYFSACLKMSEVRFQLFDSPDMYLMVEKGIRGGLSQVFARTILPNNPYVKDYDHTKPCSYGLLLDQNALYPSAQWKYKMPLQNFRWLSQDEIQNLDVYGIDVTADNGYIFHLDLAYPDEIKEKTKNFPLCPTNVHIDIGMLSNYQKLLLEELQLKLPSKNKKLAATQLDKDDLVISAVPLLVYLRLGMKIKKIHRVLSFEQTFWLQKWVEMNTKLRKEAKTEFESFTIKTALNSTFGSFLMSKRKQRKVRLVSTEKQLRRYVIQPNYQGFTILNDEISIVEASPLQIKFDRPYVLGFCTLEYARAIVYEYYYFTLKPVFQDRLTLAYVDTDSYIVHIVSENVYKELEKLQDSLDTSNYPTNHFLYSAQNKGKLLCVKDELAGRIMQQGYFIKSKCYTIVTQDGDRKKLKGVTKTATQKRIHVQDYRECVLGDDTKCIYTHQMRFENKNFILYTTKSNRMALNSFDDKSVYLNATTLVPHGYVN